MILVTLLLDNLLSFPLFWLILVHSYLILFICLYLKELEGIMQKKTFLVQQSQENEDELTWILILRKHTRVKHQRGQPLLGFQLRSIKEARLEKKPWSQCYLPWYPVPLGFLHLQAVHVSWWKKELYFNCDIEYVIT